MAAALSSGVISPAILAQLTFKSGTVWVWSGVGPLVYGGNTYQGVGTLGSIGAIVEGLTVQAAGTVISLSGIDPALYGDSMEDIVTGQPAKIFLPGRHHRRTVPRLLRADRPANGERGRRLDHHLDRAREPADQPAAAEYAALQLGRPADQVPH
jgi:hypothetical protein